ncbi:MAG: HD domain-containing protein [Bacteroidota bacterium]|nr:HD domain-containing protein [Bacteroidota bacterium]
MFLHQSELFLRYQDLFAKIGQLADDNQQEIYLIGGFVRDSILMRESDDIDIVVIGKGIDFAKIVAQALDGAQLNFFPNFGTAHINYNNLIIEFVGARKESYRSDSRNPLVEDGSLQDDQNRRDLTINAMGIALNKKNYGKLIDPFQGLDDLDSQIIRTPLDPDKTFSDDPLRMMRAIRFASQLGFRIEEKTFDGIVANKERIKIISQERITEELNKIILSPMPSIGFEYLFDTGLLKLIFPEMQALHGVETINGLSHKDNFYHTIQVLDNLAKLSKDLWLRWAAILHDIAKPATKRFEQGIGWTFHGHEDRGSKMVKPIFTKLKLPLNEKMKFVEKMVFLHLRPIVLAQEKVTDSAVRRLMMEVGEDIDQLMLLCKSDITSKNEKKVERIKQNFEQVEIKIRDVSERDYLRTWQPPISGNDIIEMLDIKKKQDIGILKNAIKQAILDGEVEDDKLKAMEYLKNLAKSKGIEWR